MLSYEQRLEVSMRQRVERATRELCEAARGLPVNAAEALFREACLTAHIRLFGFPEATDDNA